MNARDARLAIHYAREWAKEGLMPAASAATLEARYESDAREDPDRESFGAGVLYALGGVLLGSAVFALLVLLQDNGILSYEETDQVAHWLFLAWGLVCAVAAYMVDLVSRKPRLGDAFHVASLLAVTAAAFKDGIAWPYAVLAFGFALWTLNYRRRQFLLPFLALVAANVSVVAFLFAGETFEVDSEDLQMTMWLTYAVLQLVLLIVSRRQTDWSWPVFALAGATLLLAGTFLGFYFAAAEDQLPEFRGEVEVYLALVMGTTLVLGLVMREKGMVLASALVVAIDAIVFAFDVGEIVGGLLALLAVAGFLIWQAGNLRQYLREG